MQNEVHAPPSFIAFNKGDGMKLHESLIERRDWKGGMVSFCNEVDIFKRTVLRTLISFFNELNTRSRTMLETCCFVV